MINKISNIIFFLGSMQSSYISNFKSIQAINLNLILSRKCKILLNIKSQLNFICACTTIDLYKDFIVFISLTFWFKIADVSSCVYPVVAK